MNKQRTLAYAAALGVLVVFPLAGSAQTGDPHHAPVQAAAQPALPTQFPGRANGMMGGGMMMNGGMMMGQGGMGRGMAFDHIEGRIAFLKAELKITEAQASAWNPFADALRASAKQLRDLQQSMAKAGAQPAGFAQQLAAREKMLSVRLDNTRALRSSFAALEQNLSPDQKKAADELLGSRMGMGMMAAGARAE